MKYEEFNATRRKAKILQVVAYGSILVCMDWMLHLLIFLEGDPVIQGCIIGAILIGAILLLRKAWEIESWLQAILFAESQRIPENIWKHRWKPYDKQWVNLRGTPAPKEERDT